MINIQDIIPFMKDGWVACDKSGHWTWSYDLPTIYKDKFGSMLSRVELSRVFDIAPADDWTKSLIKVDHISQEGKKVGGK